MTFESFNPPRTADSEAVRWTFSDMLLVAISTLVLSVVLLLVARLPSLLGVTALQDVLSRRPLVTSMVLVGLLYSLFVVTTYFVIVRRKHVSWRELGFRVPPLLPLLLTPLVFVAQLTILIISNLVLTFIIGEFENPQVAALTDPNGFSWTNYIVAFVTVAIVAPIVEELIFRGLLYQWLRARSNVVVAVLASAAIFSGAHVFPVLLPALFGVGIVLALAFEWSKSLWVTITLHFMQNALAISAFFFIQANPNLVPQP